jgi:DNA invertase Pin-like site-specific DNA recombinase
MARNILPALAAVLYLRMSSAKQGKSIPAQRDELLKLAKLKGYTIVREYVDPAISGDDTERRVGFLKLREDCENGPDFSIILVWHEDRFSRNDPLEYGFWLKPIRDSGVILETPTGRVDWESLGGRLLSLIGQEMRHDYLRQLSRNVCRGQLTATKNGHHGTGGRSPGGYKHKDGKVLVEPDKAAVVLHAFEEYDKASASLRSVCDLFNREGILSPRGGKWCIASLQNMLKNRKYAGDYVRLRYRAGKYHAIKDGEIVTRRKGDKFEEVEPIVVENRHVAIVPRKLFDRVQRKLKGQQRRTAHKSGHRYALSGLLKCECGGPMTGRPLLNGNGERRYRYGCRVFSNKGPSACAYAGTIQEDVVIDVVVRKMQAEVFSETAILRLLVAYRKRLTARRKIVPADSGGRLRKQIDKLDQQIDQGLGRVLSAPEKLVSTIYAKIEKLRQEREQLQAQLDAAGKPETGSVLLDDAKVEEAARVLRDMREAFTDAKPEEIRDLISPLVSKIELSFSHVQEEGKKNRHLCKGGTILVRPTDPGLSLLFGISAD